MRIIAGKFRGKKLFPPPDNSIRPTSDRVREALFSILASRLPAGFSGLNVLDLFAGTGALGLEALSRGALSTIFVDNGIAARGLIRQHIDGFGVGGQAQLLKRDATRLGPVGRFTPADLVFLDPPYGRGLGEKALSAAQEGGWIAPGALLVLEEEKAVEIEISQDFALLDQRDYGATCLHFFCVSSS